MMRPKEKLELGANPIHLPQDFFISTFQCFRFVQIIIALRSNQILASSLFLTPPSSLFPQILPRAAGTRALPPLAPASPARRSPPPAPRAARPASRAPPRAACPRRPRATAGPATRTQRRRAAAGTGEEDGRKKICSTF